jgi:GDP-4-dehydro-6-deoxy-D-mannose reductase
MLVGKGFEVVGTGLRIEREGAAKSLPNDVSVINSDVRDYAILRQILEDTRPDHVYHLAAISNVVTSFKNPRLAYDVNVWGTLNLFEALRELEIRPRIVYVSTAHVYSSIETEAGLDEDSPVRLLTPYAASKFMCEALARQYFEAYGIQTVIVRPFNHVGPGQPTGFVCSDFARQIAAIKLGQAAPVLHVGALAPVRDFTDVRDTVEAYWIAATLGVPCEIYNVSSHRPISIQEVISMLCDIAGVRVRIESDQEKLRPIETLRLLGNSSKIRSLGWQPSFGLDQTLRDILDYWLSALARN